MVDGDMRAYFEQFSSYHMTDEFDRDNDYRVHEFLNLTGLLNLPDFSWTSSPVPFAEDREIVVWIRSHTKHSEMVKLIQGQYDKEFLYIVADRYWHEPDIYVGHFTMIFDEKEMRLDTWGERRYPLPNGDRLLRDGD